MPETTGAPGSVAVAAAALVGFELITVLETVTEISWQADKHLGDVIYDIGSTAAVLRQLQDILAADKTSAEGNSLRTVLKDGSFKEIQMLATKCDKLYKLVVTLIEYAFKNPRDKSRKDKDEKKEKKIVRYSKMPVPSIHSLQSYGGFDGLNWPWLEPRMIRCEDQLRWIKLGLLAQLQIVQLARLRVNPTERALGALDREIGIRCAVEALATRQGRWAKRMAKRRIRFHKNRTNASSPLSPPPPRPLKTAPVPVAVAPAGIIPPPAPVPAPVPAPFPAPVEVRGLPAGIPAAPGVMPSPASSLTSGPQVGGMARAPNAPPFGPSMVQIIEDSGPAVPPYTAAPAGQNGFIPLRPNPPPPTPASWGAPKKVKKHLGNSMLAWMATKRPGVTPGPVLGDKKEPVPIGSTDKKGPEPTAPETAAPGAAKEAAKTSRLPSFLAGWSHSIFGKNDKFITDTNSADLEAYLVENDGLSRPVQVPFGHERLKHGLKRVLASKKGTPWNQYLAISPRQRHIVDEVTKYAKTQSPHTRTFLAIEENKKEGKPGHCIVFFSLGDPVEPIHFKDAVGRKYSFPYETCKAWEDMRKLICDAFLHVEIIGPLVLDGHFDLIGPSGSIILPASWASALKPGDAITMHMWPMDKPGVRPLGGPIRPGAGHPRPGVGPPQPGPPRVPHPGIPPALYGARPAPVKPGIHPGPIPPKPAGSVPPPPAGVRPMGAPAIRPAGVAPPNPFTPPPPPATVKPIIVSTGKKGKYRPVSSRKRYGRAWYYSSDSEWDISSGEEDELDIVGFQVQAEKEEEGAAELLKRCTHIEDVQSSWAKGVINCDSFSDRETSSSSGSSSSDWIDD